MALAKGSRGLAGGRSGGKQGGGRCFLGQLLWTQARGAPGELRGDVPIPQRAALPFTAAINNRSLLPVAAVATYIIFKPHWWVTETYGYF